MTATLTLIPRNPADLSGQRTEFDKPVVTFGRRESNDVVLAGPSAGVVSGNHAEVRVESGRVFVYDLNSRNGVFVNGVRVECSRELLPEDLLSLGESGPSFGVRTPAAPVMGATIRAPADAPPGAPRPVPPPPPPIAGPGAPPNFPISVPLGAPLGALAGSAPQPSPRPSGPPPLALQAQPLSSGPPPLAHPVARPQQGQGIGAVPIFRAAPAPAGVPAAAPRDDFAANIKRLQQAKQAGMEGKQSVGMHTLMGVLGDVQKKERTKMLVIAAPIIAVLAVALGVVWWMSRPSDWRPVIAQTRGSVFLVIAEKIWDADSQNWTSGFGTAWCLEGNTFATNSHVAEMVQESLKNGGPVILRSAGEHHFDIRITDATLHPGFVAINTRVAEVQRQHGMAYKPASFFDVALLKADASECDKHRAQLRPLPLASRRKLEHLREGLPVAFVGYSVAGVAMQINAPEPFTGYGELRRLTDEADNSSDEARMLTKLTYGLAIRPGASGSPVIDQSGEVIGLIASVAVTNGVTDAGTSYGPRADLLAELQKGDLDTTSGQTLLHERVERILK